MLPATRKDLQAQISSTKEELENLQADYRKLQDERDTLSQACVDKDQRIADLTRDHSELDADLTIANERNAELADRIQSLETSQEDFDNKVAAAARRLAGEQGEDDLPATNDDSGEVLTQRDKDLLRLQSMPVGPERYALAKQLGLVA